VKVQFWSFQLLELGTERWTTARYDRFNPGGRDLCKFVQRLAGTERMSGIE
jgi:hypothetical protein